MDNQMNFFRNIPAISDFSLITQSKYYQILPNSWSVFLTDVEGSTVAIEAGQYKDVNLVGAASITEVVPVLDGIEFPYTFGGDGATLCVPNEYAEKVAFRLGQLQNLSKANYNLSLRVVCIPMTDFHGKVNPIEVGKFELKSKTTLALFRGGGVSQIDKMAKSNYEKYRIPKIEGFPPSLEGLSCRWKPIRAKKGEIVSLLVISRTESSEESDVYREVLNGIEHIVRGDLANLNPVSKKNMKYKGLLQTLVEEIQAHSSIFSKKLITKIAKVFIANFMFFLKLPPFGKMGEKYLNSIEDHCDFRKFDDGIKMVVDCTEKEKIEIQRLLNGHFVKKRIFYGTHISKEALMTCFVQGLGDGQHMHFIDGGDGGYAIAAKQLKKQIQNAAKESSVNN